MFILTLIKRLIMLLLFSYDICSFDFALTLSQQALYQSLSFEFDLKVGVLGHSLSFLKAIIAQYVGLAVAVGGEVGQHTAQAFLDVCANVEIKVVQYKLDKPHFNEFRHEFVRLVKLRLGAAARQSFSLGLAQ